jgi:hypothetical protein
VTWLQLRQQLTLEQAERLVDWLKDKPVPEQTVFWCRLSGMNLRDISALLGYDRNTVSGFIDSWKDELGK